MAWAALREAREKSRAITVLIEHLLKEHDALSKKEIAAYSEKLLTDSDEAIEAIIEEYRHLIECMKGHRKTLASKARFLTRHHTRAGD
ncbi:MAG: hypothetical protein HYY37_06430 [Candidatus Aenigmarchaeota archaeon]|nr:hypothetical protein [Candidatus Aenigmarchaeota archaeon]